MRVVEFLKKAMQGRGYWLLLLAACLVCYASMCAIPLLYGREPIWGQDCIPLYISNFEYEGKAIREALKTVVTGSGDSLLPYTYNVGYGSDSLLMLFGTLADPLNLLSALCPRKYAEFLFIALIPVRIVLVAFSFSFYCLRKGNPRSASFVASLAYAFSGFMIFLAIFKHSIFLSTTMLLPLILAGADDVFERRKYGLFIAAFAWQLLLSVYFSFMSGVLLLIYCLVKYFLAPRERSLADFLGLIIRFVGCIVAALCIAAVFVLPNVSQLLSMDRVGIHREPVFFSTLQSYFMLPARLLGGRGVVETAYVGIVGVFAAIVFIVCGKRFDKAQRRPWLVGLIILLVCSVIPYAGTVFNGFSYTTDRWLYGLGFCVSYIVCLTIPKLVLLDRRDWKRVLIASGVFLVLACAPIVLTSKSIPAIVSVCLFVVLVAVVIALARGKRRALLAFALSCGVFIGSYCAFTLYCSPFGGSYLGQMASIGGAHYQLTTDNPVRVMKDVSYDGDYRVSRPGKYSLRNAGLLQSVKAIDFFNSYYSQTVDTLQQELGLSEKAQNYIYSGSQSRLAIELIGGAKYFIVKDGDEWLIPWGYEETGVSKGKYRVLENDHALPIGFSAEKIISEDDYRSLGMVEKQEALLQGCVVQGDALSGLKTIEPSPTSQSVAYELECEGDILVEGNSIAVYDTEAQITLLCEGIENCETYVCFENLNLRAFSPREKREHSNKNVDGWTAFKRDTSWSAPDEFSFSINAEGRSRKVAQAMPWDESYGGKDDWAVNMGYSDEPMTSLVLTFSTAGIYSFDDLSIVCQPVEPLLQEADELNSGHLSDLIIDGGDVHAVMEVDDVPQMAMFTIPYSKGWTATLDGKPVEILKADTAFMAIAVAEPGEHIIELHYSTPGFTVGLAITGISVVVCMIVVIIRRRRTVQSE